MGRPRVLRPQLRRDSLGRVEGSHLSPQLTAELVDATWRRIGALDAASALKLERASGKFQPEVVGFVIGFTSDLRPEAIGLALYVMIVVLDMFRSSAAPRLRKVRDGAILKRWRTNRQLVADLQRSGVTPRDLAHADIACEEPHALRYVIAALTEEDQADPVLLTDAEAWHLLAVLKTVVDSMHGALRS